MSKLTEIATFENRYRFIRQLGQGSYGTVYLAEELGTGDLLFDDEPLDADIVLREVAVKLLHGTEHSIRRFSQEVRALCRVDHPNIVTVHDYGWSEQPYVVMGFVNGGAWSDLLGYPAQKDYVRTLERLAQIADGVGHAHARGIVHRDLKPGNILLDAHGQPQIVDFGLSRLINPDEPQSHQIGTYGYMAPELFKPDTAAAADHRVDIYSLGALIYATFAGVSPFHSDGWVSTISRQVQGDVVYADDFPDALIDLVEACVSNDVQGRPRTAAHVAEQLRKVARRTVAPRSLPRTTTSDSAKRIDVHGLVCAQPGRFAHPSRGAGVKLLARADESSVGVFAYEGRSGSLQRLAFNSLESAWPGATLNLFGALPIQKEGAGIVLAVDGESVPVLHPEWMVSATDVAKVEGVRAGPCASRQWVDYRSPHTPSLAIVRGGVLHTMLEYWVDDVQSGGKRRSPERAFTDALQKHHIALVAAGLRDDGLAKFQAELEPHWQHIRDATDELTRESTAAHSDGDAHHVTAEPQRFSTSLGLTGRADLVVDRANKVSIHELKTGGYENPEHERQLRCYALLWREGNEDREVDAELLYSKTGKRRPLRFRGVERERSIVLARNACVAMWRWIADGDTTPPPSFGDEPAKCNDAPCRYRRERCEQQCNLLGSHDGQHIMDISGKALAAWGTDDEQVIEAGRAYIAHFTRLLMREQRVESEKLATTLRADAISERVARGDAAMDVRFEAGLGGSSAGATAAGELRLTGNGLHAFHVGERVVLHRPDWHDGNAYFGRVTGRSDRRFDSESDSEPDKESDSVATVRTTLQPGSSVPRDGWVLDRETIRVGNRSAHRAMLRWAMSRRPELHRWVLWPADIGDEDSIRDAAIQADRDGATGTATPAVVVGNDATGLLNEAQQLAVHRAMTWKDPVLISGPPGTGKTAIIEATASRLVGDGQRVLLSAFTNAAVDNMLARVIAGGTHDVMRIGSSARASDALLRAISDAGLLPTEVFTDDLANCASSFDATAERIGGVAIVAATTHACAGSAVFDIAGASPAFDVAIIDEAAQLPEPLTLGVMTMAKRVVLVGDERQLPPVVTAHDVRSKTIPLSRDAVLQQGNVAGLDQSYFARVKAAGGQCCHLTTQYRMSAEIQDFASRTFYDNALIPAAQIAGRRLQISDAALRALPDTLRSRLDPNAPCVWVAPASELTPGVSDRTPRRCNRAEAKAVVATVAALIASVQFDRRPVDSQLVGVVTPYRAQRHAIEDALARELGPDLAALVEVDTVERFQGREKEVMCISLVVSEGNTFVFDPKRLNVAMTRARSKLIVFGSTNLRRRLGEAYS